MRPLLVNANRNLALLLCGAVAAVSFGLFAVNRAGVLDDVQTRAQPMPKYVPGWLPEGVRLERLPSDPPALLTAATVHEMALSGTPIAGEVLSSPNDLTFRFAQAWPRVGDVLADDAAVSGGKATQVGALRVLVRTEGDVTTMSWRESDGTRITATVRVAATDIDRFVSGVHRVSTLEWNHCCAHAVVERVSTL